MEIIRAVPVEEPGRGREAAGGLGAGLKGADKWPVQRRVTYVFPFPRTASLMSPLMEEGRRGGQVRAVKLSLRLTWRESRL